MKANSTRLVPRASQNVLPCPWRPEVVKDALAEQWQGREQREDRGDRMDSSLHCIALHHQLLTPLMASRLVDRLSYHLDNRPSYRQSACPDVVIATLALW